MKAKRLDSLTISGNMCRNSPVHKPDHVSDEAFETSILYILTSRGRKIPAHAKLLVINQLLLPSTNIKRQTIENWNQ